MKNGITVRVVNAATIPARAYGHAVAQSMFDTFIQKAQAVRRGQGVKMTFRAEKSPRVAQRMSTLRAILTNRHLIKQFQPLQRSNSLYLVRP
jgi:uncharacterized protein (DUF1501 family)